jgi:hypothetical protein
LKLARVQKMSTFYWSVFDEFPTGSYWSILEHPDSPQAAKQGHDGDLYSRGGERLPQFRFLRPATPSTKGVVELATPAQSSPAVAATPLAAGEQPPRRLTPLLNPPRLQQRLLLQLVSNSPTMATPRSASSARQSKRLRLQQRLLLQLVSNHPSACAATKSACAATPSSKS